MDRYMRTIRRIGRSSVLWVSIVLSFAIAATVPNTLAQGDITAGCG